MKFLTAVILFLLPCTEYAQIILSGTIVDAESRDPIPYANIGIKKDGVGTVSNLNGYFEFEAVSPEAFVTISSIGFETKEIEVKSLMNSQEIFLSRMNYEMEEVRIVSSRFEDKEIIIGAKNKNRGHSFGFGSAQLGSEIGAAIRIEKPTFILSANFVLNHAKGDSLLFRVKIYDFKNGVIGENLLKENVLIKEKQRKGIFSVDLRNQNLVLNNDVLLTLEWLSNFDEVGNKEITFDTRKTKKLFGIFYKYSSNGAFSKMDTDEKYSPCFYFIGKKAI